MKLLKNLLKNQSGFSMVEVLVAAGMMGVIAYTFMHMGEQVTLMESRMKDMMELNDLESRLRIQLAETQACIQTISVKQSELKTNEKLYFPVKLQKVLGKYGQPLIEANKRYGRLEVQDIDIIFNTESIPKKHFENEIGFVYLNYKIKPITKNSMVKHGRIGLSAVISHPTTSPQGPYLIACFSENSLLVQEVTAEVMRQTCASLGVNYDSTKGACDMGNLLNAFNSNKPTQTFPSSPPSSTYTSSTPSTSSSTPSTAPASTAPASEAVNVQKMQEMQQKAMEMMNKFIQESGSFNEFEDFDE